MKRGIVGAVVLALVVSLATVSVALAGWGGVFRASDLTFTGTYSGAGNADATYTLTAYGTGTCINPGDQGPVPGQSGEVEVVGTFTSVELDQQGNIVFEAVVLSSDACPNDQWISDVEWTSAVATATYSKGNKEVSDTSTFTCGPDPSDPENHQLCTEDGYNGNKYNTK
jgi:hypothetical protein